MYKLGLDLGSSYTKGVVVDNNNRIVDYQLVKTGFDYIKATGKIIERFSEKYQIGFPLYTCGYGREEIEQPHVANSEIIALSAAVFNIYKRKCAVIDIGGQDTKYIKINEQGQVDKFRMNRKCAAGTGSFIEEIAFRMDISPSEFSRLASESSQDVKINSYCTVFAVSEIVGMVKKGSKIPDIINGIYNSIISRCSELSPVEDFLVITGGVPDNHPAIVKLFKKTFKDSDSPPKSQFLAAYGCVLLNNLQK
jgi:predicted CoA-substrate-specific enzyme activase